MAKRLNATQILTGFLWNDEVQEILKVKMDKDGKIEIDQDSQMKYLMVFQDFLEYYDKKDKESVG